MNWCSNSDAEPAPRPARWSSSFSLSTAGTLKREVQPEIRRCRPLLGTFVEISASGLAAAALQKAINTAFAAVDRIHRLMSAHDPASELSLLNREAARHTVTVNAELFKVLRRADLLAVESSGAFDYTVAATLARWGLLPAQLARKKAGDWRDVLLFGRRQVRFRRPLALDLGGIAKGFAVDLALETLRDHDVAAAIVNAGGDLRAFGPQPVEVHLRHPTRPTTFAGKISVCDSALATSSPCFTERDLRGRRVSHLVNSNRGASITGAVSATVRARECWLADALTKVVLNAPCRAETLLAKYEAEAFMLTA